MTKKTVCGHCGTEITFNGQAWVSEKFLFANYCFKEGELSSSRFHAPAVEELHFQPKETISQPKAVCKTCKQDIYLSINNQWVVDDEKLAAIGMNQYCRADPVLGSELHSPDEVSIVPMTIFDEEEYIGMLRSYLDDLDITPEFIEKILPTNRQIFRKRFMDADSPLWGYFLYRNGEVAGFFVLNHQQINWSMRDRVYLEDLYVKPQFRRNGLGDKVMEWLHAEKEKKNWFQVYWTTEKTNVAGQALYQKHSTNRDCLIFQIGGDDWDTEP